MSAILIVLGMRVVVMIFLSLNSLTELCLISIIPRIFVVGVVLCWKLRACEESVSIFMGHPAWCDGWHGENGFNIHPGVPLETLRGTSGSPSLSEPCVTD